MAAAPNSQFPNAPTEGSPRVIGRYAIYGEIARGGMATVHFGRLLGSVGFSRTVAIKRLHPQYASDPEFVQMFLDEAHVAARIQHPHVVPTLDVVAHEGELLLVMEYVQGESLSKLLAVARARNVAIPAAVTSAIVSNALWGLHAAHEAKTEAGDALGLVHRDMSPQNVLVGVDGVARVLDFGIAKASGRAENTREGRFKGKLSYVAPEQIRGQGVDRRTDLYSTAVVLWEMVTLKRLFRADSEWALLAMVRDNQITKPSVFVPNIPAALEALILRGLAGDPQTRFATAREMAMALEALIAPANPREVAEWLQTMASDVLHKRAKLISSVEQSSQILMGSTGANAITDMLREREVESRRDRVSLPSSRPPNSITANSITAPAVSGTFPHELPPKRRIGLFLGLFVVIGLLLGVVVFQFSARKPAATVNASAKSSAKDSDGSGKDSSSTRGSNSPESGKLPVADINRAGAPVEEKVGSIGVATNVATLTSVSPPKAGAKPAAVPIITKPSSKVTPTPAVVVPATPSPPVAPTPVAANCSPPYTIDASGIRHPKPECL